MYKKDKENPFAAKSSNKSSRNKKSNKNKIVKNSSKRKTKTAVVGAGVVVKKNKKSVKRIRRKLSTASVVEKTIAVVVGEEKQQAHFAMPMTMPSSCKSSPSIGIVDTDTAVTKHSTTAVVSRVIEETWYSNYRQLVRFYNQHGHSNVLRSDSNKRLSGWVKRQRNNLKVNKLSHSKIQALNDLNFVWNRLEGAWYAKYERLAQFSSRHNHTEVPTNYNRSLAEWAQRQRREYRNDCLTMTTTRIAHLESLAKWSWGRVRTTSTSTTASSTTASTIEMRDALEEFELPLPMPIAVASCSFEFDAEHIFI